MIDAQCNSVTIDGNTEVPDKQSPAGSRTIKTVTAAVFVYATECTDFATYNKLSEAVAAINNGTHKGNISIYINGDFTETATVTLNCSGSGASSYTGIAIYPFNGNRVISCSLADALLAFNGAEQ